MSEIRRFGAEVPNFVAPPRPGPEALEGRLVRLERLDADLHAADLHRAFAGHDSLWDYLPYGPFSSAARYHRWVKETAGGPDPVFYALRNRETGHCGGVASFLRITPEAGSIEVGHICIAPEMQRSPAATEAMYLMMVRVFDELGYRRYEWKCDALNAPSRAAARRLGFRFEGIFRNATVYKGRNRDTAWFAMTDADWPLIKAAFEAWLAPGNFDAAGRQRAALATPGQ